MNSGVKLPCPRHVSMGQICRGKYHIAFLAIVQGSSVLLRRIGSASSKGWAVYEMHLGRRRRKWHVRVNEIQLQIKVSPCFKKIKFLFNWLPRKKKCHTEVYISGKIKLKHYKWIWNQRKVLERSILKNCLNKNNLMLQRQTHKYLLCYMPAFQKRLTVLAHLFFTASLQSPCVDCLFSGGSPLLRCLIRKKVTKKGGPASPNTPRTARPELNWTEIHLVCVHGSFPLLSNFFTNICMKTHLCPQIMYIFLDSIYSGPDALIMGRTCEWCSIST